MSRCVSTDIKYGFFIFEGEDDFSKFTIGDEYDDADEDGEQIDFININDHNDTITTITNYDETIAYCISSSKFDRKINFDDRGGNASTLLYVNNLDDVLEDLVSFRSIFDDEIKILCKRLNIAFRPCSLVVCGEYS